jgi:hypothetical protein
MRLRLAAAAAVSIILIGLLGAPALPVMVGAALAYACLLWRSLGAR